MSRISPNKRAVNEMLSLYKEAKFKELARKLPHVRDIDNVFIKFLNQSNLLRMRDHVDDPPFTVGADPEFILGDKKTKEVVLFSSRIYNFYGGSVFNLAEAAIGADYGLLEIRTPPASSSKELVESFGKLISDFAKGSRDMVILQEEAVEFDHKRQRTLEQIGDKSIDHGMSFRGKAQEVWAENGQGEGGAVLGLDSFEITMSAYGEPIFAQYNPNLLTAGGHIHVGGAYVKMLSFEQLQSLVRHIDNAIRPMCEDIETPAGKLRRTAYGFPGEFKVKEYGFEYRSLSNAVFWEENHKVLAKVLAKVENIVKTFATKATHN